MPTGATVAALTTSLPETPGGERNWDYRYTWMRDATFTLQALHWLNLDWEADEFMQFVADLEPTEDGSLQIMYGIDGRRDLTESTRDDLSGYEGARPVRIGNGAFDQRQNDVYGAVLDSILLHTRRSQRLPRRLWPIVESQAECATKVWREPDQGIWEARGAPQHYVSSKLMCWVALDRAAKLAEIRGDAELAQEAWRATAEEIRADILEHGVSERGVLRQHYATDALDASTLLAAIFGFLPENDERLRKTVLAIADELTENGFVLRYRTDETDDGLSGEEGTFLICSFWLVSALAIIGELRRARDLMERLLRIASPLGLYAEEFDTASARHLGNFPQAFSHLALIEAAARIIVARAAPGSTVTGSLGGVPASARAPSGLQLELTSGRQRAVVVEVGGGIRTYSDGETRPARRLPPRRAVRGGPRTGAHAVAEPVTGRPLRVRGRASPTGARRAGAAQRDSRPRPLSSLEAFVERQADRVVMQHRPRGRGAGIRSRSPSASSTSCRSDGLRVRTIATQRRCRSLPVRERRAPVPERSGTARRRRRAPLRACAGQCCRSDRPRHSARARCPSPTPSATSAARGRSGRRGSTTASPTSSATRTGSPASSSGLRAKRGASRSGRTAAYPYRDALHGRLRSLRINRRSLAVEPMSCPPNAFRTGEALIALDPGSSWVGEWGIEPLPRPDRDTNQFERVR